MRIFFISLALSFFLSPLFAQCPPAGNLVFNTQASLDAFAINYPSCTIINGDVTISGADIVDLSRLNGVREISGVLLIQDNPALQSINGLTNLQKVDGIHVIKNHQLGDIILNNLLLVGEEGLRINKSSYATLIQFSKLKTVTGYFWIDFNGVLTNLSCPVLEHIEGEMALIWNSNLSTIQFPILKTLGKGLAIQLCHALTNLNGLASLIQINRELLLLDNSTLSDISAISQTNLASILTLKIKNNYNLATCSIQPICAILPNGCVEVEITGNATGCATKNEVIVNCNQTLQFAKVFLDCVDPGSMLMEAYAGSISGFPQMDPYSFPPLNAYFSHSQPIPPAVQINSSLLSVNGPNAIVDWLFIELRSGVSGATNVSRTKTVLLQRDGDIVDADGISRVTFSGLPPGNYYIAIRHRNHYGFRTQNTYAISNCLMPALDFTNGSVNVYGSDPLLYHPAGNYYTMIGGDANADGSIDAFDTIIWGQTNGLFGQYLQADYNMDGSVDAFDTLIWALNNGKFQELD